MVASSWDIIRKIFNEEVSTVKLEIIYKKMKQKAFKLKKHETKMKLEITYKILDSLHQKIKSPSFLTTRYLAYPTTSEGM